jgi:hypothetical protein
MVLELVDRFKTLAVPHAPHVAAALAELGLELELSSRQGLACVYDPYITE